MGDGKKSQLGLINQLLFVGSEWNEQDFKTDIKHIYDQLNFLKKNASNAKSELANSILVDNNDIVQHVTVPQRVTGKIQTQDLLVSKIVTKSLNNDLDPTVFLNSFVLNSNNVQISGGLVFENLIKVNNLNTTTINRIHVANIARYSLENVFECPVQFTNGMDSYGNVVTPTINGMSVQNELMFASNISGYFKISKLT